MKTILIIFLAISTLTAQSGELWMTVGQKDGWTYQYNPISEDRKYAYSRNVKLDEPYIGYSLVTKFEIDCREDVIRVVGRVLKNSKGEEVFAEKTSDSWMRFVPGSPADIAFPYWCKDNKL